MARGAASCLSVRSARVALQRHLDVDRAGQQSANGPEWDRKLDYRVGLRGR